MICNLFAMGTEEPVNQERPNEAIAKQIFERVTGIRLEHADTHGGVDYVSHDRIVALEVTAVTEGTKRGARDALSRSKLLGSPTKLQGCWLVFADDRQPKMKTFIQRVQPAIAELEFAGETSFDKQRAIIRILGGDARSRIYGPLLDAGVERATYAPHPDDGREENHVHSLIVLTGDGGSTGGSNDSLNRLMEELRPKTDNAEKLAISAAKQRHLFVWLDDDTAYDIARPLSRSAPSWAEEGWSLPTERPSLSEAITHLWVVHEGSRRGWMWDGVIWHQLLEP